MACTGVLIRFFGALDKSVKLNKCIRPTGRGKIICRSVSGGKFSGKVGEISEGEFTGIRPVAYAKEAGGGRYEITERSVVLLLQDFRCLIGNVD